MTILRQPWTTETTAVQTRWLGAVDDGSTEVTLADGSSYTIPAGERGSFAWARQASLIAAAYHQLGDDARAYPWNREYDKRLAVWEQVQAGEDLQLILASIPTVDLLAPFRIAWNAATQAVETVNRAGQATVGLLQWVPWLALGALVVLGIGFQRRSLRVSRGSA